MTSAKVGQAVMELEETSHAVKVVMMFAQAAVVDQRVVAVAAAEVLAQTDQRRVSASDSTLKADLFQVTPVRTWPPHRQVERDRTPPERNRGLQNVRHAIRGVSATTVANPGRTLALSVGQTGTGAPRKLLAPICQDRMAQQSAPTRQPTRFPRPKALHRAKDAHGTVTDAIARPVQIAPNRGNHRNRRLRQWGRSSLKSHVGPISQRTTGQQFQRRL